MTWHRWIHALPARLRALVRPGASERDLDDEMSFHVAMQAEANRQRGMSGGEAERRARMSLEGIEAVKEQSRDARPLRWARTLNQDVRFAVRSLRRARGFTTIAVVTLALGIAATATAVAVSKAVLLNPLPFPDPERLVMVWERTPSGEARNFVNAFNYSRWRSRNQVFDAIGAIAQIPMNVSGRGDAEQVDGFAVTAGFFDALGVRPFLGRSIRAEDESSPQAGGVVLGYGFWQRRFGGALDVVGRLLIVNGVPRQILGVMPPGFAFPAARAVELYAPLPIHPAAPASGRNLITVARMKRGVTLESARADMQRVARLGEQGIRNNAGWSASVLPLFEETVGQVRRVLWVVVGAVACLLLLACVNVANLLLMRTSKRTPELAVRVALGAGRWRLVQQLAAESLMLTLVAGLIGLIAAAVVVPSIPSLFPPTFALPRSAEIRIDGSIVVLTLIVSAVIGLVFSLMPLARDAHRHLTLLRAGARSAFATYARLRRILVGLEVAVAVVLVFGAALMGTSLAKLSSVNPGFNGERVLTLRMLMLPNKYRQPERQIAFLGTVLDEVRKARGVVSASSVHFLPLSGVASSAPVLRTDRPAPPQEQMEGSPVSVITEGYFKTMGIPLQGRDFNSADRRGGPGVVIVNQSLARLLFPNENPLGKHVRAYYSPATSDMEIVGIAGDVRTSTLDREPGPAIYIAHAQEPSLVASLVIRTQAAPASAVEAVRAAIARVDAEQGVSQVQPLETVMANAVAGPRIEAGVLGAFGGLALLIAAVGLYGVLAYSVEQRRRELGLKLALGAVPKTLRRAVVREGVGMTAIGALLGAALAWASSSSLEGLLYDTRPTDPAIVLVVGATLVAVACLATLVPAVRATRVDPLIVLRDE